MNIYTVTNLLKKKKNGAILFLFFCITSHLCCFLWCSLTPLPWLWSWYSLQMCNRVTNNSDTGNFLMSRKENSWFIFDKSKILLLMKFLIFVEFFVSPSFWGHSLIFSLSSCKILQNLALLDNVKMVKFVLFKNILGVNYWPHNVKSLTIRQLTLQWLRSYTSILCLNRVKW